ncbi:helix-turn-helix domain-containing protein [Sphingomonas sp. 1P06PA]|uniref:helix-turn-helix domain-containing protein n=1 Tax=Sphingomonas sp. 1P06PA TaxID=554121 RepID=UPI0039A734B5
MSDTGTETAGLSTARVGERLSVAREALGLSVDDIAERTRVPVRHLRTIEAGGTEGLPASTYSVGFVRTYASAVGLDPADIAKQFRGELGQTPVRAVPEPFEPADPARVPPRLLAIVALVVAVLIAGAYAIWRGDSLFGSGAEDRERLAAGTDPSAQPLPGAAPGTTAPMSATPAAADGPVTVIALAPSWVKIYDGSNTLFMGVMAADQRFAVPATAVNPMIWTGQPEKFRIEIGTSVAPAFGTPGKIVRDVSLKPAALRAAAATPGAPSVRAEPLVPPPTTGVPPPAPRP